MKIFTCVLFGLGFLVTEPAAEQDAKAVLDKLSKKVESYSTISVDYNTTIEDKGETVVDFDGTAKIKGNSFALKMEDYHIYSDGKSVWTVTVESNECFINDLQEMQEEQDISPSELFTIWEKGFKHEHKGTITEDGKIYTQINLYPTDSSKEYHTIILHIDEGKMEMKKAIIKGRDGQTMTYTINSFRANESFTAEDFKFNQAEYPGCDCDDQRF